MTDKQKPTLENIALSFDPAFDRIDEILKVLREFIISRGLIIYGGLAIDYALRLHGDKIYPDDLLQVDYDFQSPDAIEDAYTLSELFYGILHEHSPADTVRTIRGIHIQTMRVDIGDNHFLADVSYVPKSVFDKLPSIEYRGMKIRHPDMQRIDMHSSLAFPYDNAPMEVIFHRWKKDITRFNLLARYYPIESDYMMPVGRVKTTLHPASTQPTSTQSTQPTIINGFAAYGLYYNELYGNDPAPADIIPGWYFSSVDSTGASGGASKRVAASTVTPYYEFYGSELCLASTELHIPAGATGVERYRPYINLVPELLYYTSDTRVCVEVLEGKQIGVVKIQKHYVVCIQYLLKYFLGRYLHAVMVGGSKDGSGDTDISEVYLGHYVSTLKMVNVASHPELTGLTATTLGSSTSLTKKTAIENMLADMGKPSVTAVLPRNYYPSRGKRPTFDPTGNPIYSESGEPIVD
tara:strand:- start:2427 stop:3821 length:1395 start_codon:yes stop_codon:yes gene_type:complete